jgi:hypothetical protein
MTNLGLQAEGLIVLPLRFETISIGEPRGAVDQGSFIHQYRVNNHAGVECKLTSSAQANTQVDCPNITQTPVRGGANLSRVIEDSESMF